MTENTTSLNGQLIEQMSSLPSGSEVTGNVDFDPGHEEAARQAAERVGVETDALDNLEEGYIDQGMSPDKARKAVDEIVADMLDAVPDEEELPEALFTGVVEVGRPGKQPNTAERVNDVCNDDPKLCKTTLQEAELGGIDIAGVTEELDAAENNRRDGLAQVGAGKLAEETHEGWDARLEHLQDVARLCVWDDERNRPAIDPAVLESRKERATWQASQEAALLVRDPEKCEDQEVIEAIAGSLVDNTDKLKQIAQQIADLKERLTFASVDGQKQKLERAIVAAEKRQRVLTETNGTTDTVLAQNQVARILEQRAHADIEDEALRSPEELEKAISERINADKYPWTMPGAETVTSDKMEKMQAYYETLVRHQFPKTNSNEVRIAGLSYMPDDKAFLERNGVKPVEGYYNVFSREDLRRAGVFFVNTVGEGEQPIFGEVVADREGQFDPREKTFLTKEEFERVYNFQQRAGYGIGDLDPDDVVMDMIAADQVRNTREHNLVSVERIDKNGTTSSLFVDNDGGGLPGSFGGFFEIGGKRYRLTAVQANLINGHGDYPGVSEMYHPSFVVWDQRYMTASQYVKDVYSPPPTPQEVFYSIKSGTSTKRERDWLGVPLFILDK